MGAFMTRGLAIAVGLYVGSSVLPALAAERIMLVPAATTDVKGSGGRSVAVLAGGCFWTMEAVFSHLKGVQSVTTGYAGGTAATANYDAVSNETTRHAEAVRIVYDPAQISYATLLRVYFSVGHNPILVNRQGPDSGASYRSAIFPQDAAQAQVARAYIAQLDSSNSWGAPLATHIESGKFFPAEAFHQNFAQRNPSYGYVVAWDAPKIVALQKTFPKLWTPHWAT